MRFMPVIGALGAGSIVAASAGAATLLAGGNGNPRALDAPAATGIGTSAARACAGVAGGLVDRDAPDPSYPAFTGTVAAGARWIDARVVGCIDGPTIDDVAPIATAAPAALVPEPASWLMVAGGFGLLGAALRRRKRATVAFR